MRSKGAPVRRHGHWVVQADKIPIRSGIVRVRFLSRPTGVDGVCLKPLGKGGSMELSDGRRIPVVGIWHEEGLPETAEHRVSCPSGTLRVWNRYMVRYTDGALREEEWTGNAGMVVLESRSSKRRYGCSNNRGSFSPTDLEFEVEWAADGL